MSIQNQVNSPRHVSQTPSKLVSGLITSPTKRPKTDNPGRYYFYDFHACAVRKKSGAAPERLIEHNEIVRRTARVLRLRIRADRSIDRPPLLSEPVAYVPFRAKMKLFADLGTVGERFHIHNITRYCGYIYSVYECHVNNGVPPAVRRQIRLRVECTSHAYTYMPFNDHTFTHTHTYTRIYIHT